MLWLFIFPDVVNSITGASCYRGIEEEQEIYQTAQTQQYKADEKLTSQNNFTKAFVRIDVPAVFLPSNALRLLRELLLRELLLRELLLRELLLRELLLRELLLEGTVVECQEVIRGQPIKKGSPVASIDFSNSTSGAPH